MKIAIETACAFSLLAIVGCEGTVSKNADMSTVIEPDMTMIQPPKPIECKAVNDFSFGAFGDSCEIRPSSGSNLFNQAFHPSCPGTNYKEWQYCRTDNISLSCDNLRVADISNASNVYIEFTQNYNLPNAGYMEYVSNKSYQVLTGGILLKTASGFMSLQNVAKSRGPLVEQIVLTPAFLATALQPMSGDKISTIGLRFEITSYCVQSSAVVTPTWSMTGIKLVVVPK